MSEAATSSAANVAAAATKPIQSKVGKYVQEIQAMMYTFGDVRNPSADTAEFIEDVVHAQLVDIVLKAAMLAQRRGSKSISQEDMVFVIRHDVAKLKRLREFLNWKDVRKNVKQSEETNASNASTVIPFDVDAVAEEEDEATETMSVSAMPSKASKPAATKSNSKKRAYCYWDCLASLVAEATDGAILDTEPIDYDEELEELKQERLRRLQEADRVTRDMSKSEYMEFTECRQASFTYKKAKKFRDWLGIPISVTEYRLSDEVLEILGFQASEIVRQITEGAISYRDQEPRTLDEDTGTVSLFQAPKLKEPVAVSHVVAYLQSRCSPDTRSKIKLY